MNKLIYLLAVVILLPVLTSAQGTRLLRQPDISETHIVYAHGGDLWVTDLSKKNTVRLTSTPTVEQDPHFSPDGMTIAFTSSRSGSDAIYIVPITGGSPTRLTWHPSQCSARGWTNDGNHILYSSTRETAPSNFGRLWTVPVTGGPSIMLTEQWGHDGSYAPDGSAIVIDKVRRWDSEWRGYRGGQNTPLIVLNLADNSEQLIPCERTTDIKPVWLGDMIYFLSDRDGVSNIWSFHSETSVLTQLTTYEGSDVKSLAGDGATLVFEREGYFSLLDIATGAIQQLEITISGDFPWAETKWENVGERVRAASLSPTGKRAIVSARGEIFTIPVEHGDARNITKSSDAADRAPIWSPNGDTIAWFSDADGEGYALMMTSQDGLSEIRKISIGESKMAWEPAWSPDGKMISFVDDDARIRIVDIAKGSIRAIDNGGNNLERGNMEVSWSPDSKWLAYHKSGSNSFRQIKVWSVEDNSIHTITNSFADSFSPSWDRDGRHLYFLASTDLALGSGWANTSSMTSNPEYAAYVINLRADDPSPFIPRSDEEDVKKKEEEKSDDDDDSKKDKKKGKKNKKKDSKKADDIKKGGDDDTDDDKAVKIDFEGIERRIMDLPIPVRNYYFTLSGPKGSVFIGEGIPNSRGATIHKYKLEDRESKEFVSGVRSISISADGKQLLGQVNGSWKVMGAEGGSGSDGKSINMDLQMKLNREQEWKQMFEDAWRYERDYFYDPNMHGRDWNVVHDRYAPLLPFVKHRTDLTYILDQVNGELSVGHSFVFGGDFPEGERSQVGLLGVDLTAENGRWKISRIYTAESWNPGLTSPLDRPDLKVKEGHYLVGINGEELSASDDPFEFLDGTANRQTIIHTHKKPQFEGAEKEIVTPISNENGLRRRAWVEDNRRLVDKLSDGKLGYVWVPNTGGPGFVSFNRYFFAQQDKEGAVIDERFNGGGLLDDYMVDLMTRSLRAAITNEVPNGAPLRLPTGILGPKVLLINEMAGSGGDFFPWIFRQQKVGPLIGARTWGGLVKSSVHYGLVDGGALTAPDNAVFDPATNQWVAENEGVGPDIAVRQDALSLSQGKDPQLERAVQEVLRLIEEQGGMQKIIPPPYPTPAKVKE